MLSINCDNCGVSFNSYPSLLKGQKHHFCSRFCFGSYRDQGVTTFKCKRCSKQKTYKVKHYKKSKTHFCSAFCYHAWRKENFKTIVECPICGKRIKCSAIHSKKTCSEKCSYVYRANKQKGALNKMWKGDNVKLAALHDWVRRRLPQPEVCSCCYKKNAKLDLANISQHYLRNLTDWEYLCRKCHMTKDGRIKNLTSYRATQTQRPTR